MINQVIRLTAPRQFEVFSIEEEVTDQTVIVRPTFLSICHADQRYYTGSRDQAVLKKKLPMALIHEGIGEVVLDKTGTFEPGQRVVVIPNTPIETSETIAENYLPTSKFRSSGYDGLLQEYVFSTPDRLVPVPDTLPSAVAAYTELISVAMHAVNRLQNRINGDHESLGVWGDGNLGFITSLILKRTFPDAKIYVFGLHKEKLDYFSFAHQVYQVDEIPEDLHLSHAFECVGGMGSQDAINQIIDHIKPEGTISLMGVSERRIEINTRMVLERGLTLFGSSRSGREDFVKTIQFLHEHPNACKRLEGLVGVHETVSKLADIGPFFEKELQNTWGKAVMKWEV
ncbi:alcohol dehydrogenase catalytic domain-containing protein [Enterococcus faecium]|uniref:ribitol-5-phosphate dehydrogenase n=1 Tax=Enterococcus casseliflavus TaxID=37734 RepID=UPI001AD72F7B|nr:ribitol-5-phosphate dehydrogenase [Enterococcus casseliflavus]EME8175621.1 alcohol dehydrogenase catalytic domain-containing protein [Enterococcus faecium]EMF0359519.1 alcohol dehydrogenase catalytic domain-containing protein [Enterococcus faecium]MBO6359878.1 ribitol-5-phosphate dehydrogenase [Enterococcus casseliflavus]MBO6377728.1 ribitol-5-phosphate dehydrogenase [Enterococcus casseliflavus]